jgi:glycosyltransferase involved in cell wall biosynthesis
MKDRSAHAFPAMPDSTRLRISLCLLTLNEIEGCNRDIPRLPLDSFDEVFAVDGGSSDGTVKFLEAHGISVYRQPVAGYNQAYCFAFSKCSTDALIFYHPKGSIDPAEAAKFRSFLEQGYDLVVASRMIRGARNEEDDYFFRPRKWFVLGLGLLAAGLWRRRGPMLWDVLHGFRAMRRSQFFKIKPLQTGLTIDLEMVVRSYRYGLKMVEFPILERKRRSGTTHFKALPTGLSLLKYLLLEFGRPIDKGIDETN